MPRSKGVKVWVVWRWDGRRWRRGWVEATRREAFERAHYELDNVPNAKWRITSATVMPPGERGR